MHQVNASLTRIPNALNNLRNIFILLDLVEIQTDDTSDVLKMPRNGNEAGGGDELESTDSKQCGDSVESSGNVSPTVDKEEDKLLGIFLPYLLISLKSHKIHATFLQNISSISIT